MVSRSQKADMPRAGTMKTVRRGMNELTRLREHGTNAVTRDYVNDFANKVEDVKEKARKYRKSKGQPE